MSPSLFQIPDALPPGLNDMRRKAALGMLTLWIFVGAVRVFQRAFQSSQQHWPLIISFTAMTALLALFYRKKISVSFATRAAAVVIMAGCAAILMSADKGNATSFSLLYLGLALPLLTLFDSPRTGWIATLVALAILGAATIRPGYPSSPSLLMASYLAFGFLMMQVFSTGLWNIILGTARQNEELRLGLVEKRRDQEELFLLLSDGIRQPLRLLHQDVTKLAAAKGTATDLVQDALQQANHLARMLLAGRIGGLDRIQPADALVRFRKQRSQTMTSLLLLTFALGGAFATLLLARNLFLLRENPAVPLAMMSFMAGMAYWLYRTRRPNHLMHLMIFLGLFGGAYAGYFMYQPTLGLAPLTLLIPAALLVSFLITPALSLASLALNFGILIAFVPSASPAETAWINALITMITAITALGVYLEMVEKKFNLQQARDLSALEQTVDTIQTLRVTLRHDLANPLSVIRMSLEDALAEGRSTTKEEHQLLMRNANSMQDIAHMVSLLVAAKGDTGILTSQTVSAHRLLTETTELFRFFGDQKNLALEPLVIGGDFSVRVHPQAFVNSVLGNLVSNAIKFSDGNGVIRLLAKRMDGWAKFEVQNSGRPVERELLERLNRHERVDSTPGTLGEIGTGQGLRLAATYLKAMGGRIRLENTPNGVIGTIELPLIETPPTETSQPRFRRKPLSRQFHP